MSNNLLRKTMEPETIPAMVYSNNAKIGELFHKCLTMIGFKIIKVVNDEATALEAIDSFSPKVVIMFSDLKNEECLSVAKKINKKRASDGRRTPKILALMKPSSKDIEQAKKDGFWDVLALPAPPAALAGRLETVLTRLD